jgi:hypothetical protein
MISRCLVYLLQPPMLLHSPHSHDIGCRCQEEVSGNGLRRYIKSNPMHNLGSVVCTRDRVKQEPIWNLVSALPVRCSQILQYDMAVEVRELAHNGDCKPDVHLDFTYRVVVRVVHKICNKPCKCPVISAIAVNVCKRSSCMAKTMHEKCFESTFQVMKAPGIEGVGLHRVGKRAFRKTKVDINLGIIVEDRVDDQWAKILKEKQRSVGNLGPQILEYHLRAISCEAVL